MQARDPTKGGMGGRTGEIRTGGHWAEKFCTTLFWVYTPRLPIGAVYDLLYPME